MDRSSDFTGNNYWESPGNVINPSDHPATNMPTATEHHDGTVLKDKTRYGDDAGGEYSTNQARFWARREENK